MNNETPQLIRDDRPIAAGTAGTAGNAAMAGTTGTTARRIELDWTESEWFQVWLDLARRPRSRQATDRELVLYTG